jgi:hypothetical protein
MHHFIALYIRPACANITIAPGYTLTSSLTQNLGLRDHSSGHKHIQARGLGLNGGRLLGCKRLTPHEANLAALLDCPDRICVFAQEVDVCGIGLFGQRIGPLDHKLDVPGKYTLELLLIRIARGGFARLPQNAVVVSEVGYTGESEGIGQVVVGIISRRPGHLGESGKDYSLVVGKC